MNEQRKIRLRVFKFAPATDVASRYECFEIPYLWPRMTILDALEYVTEVLGNDLAYRSSCGVSRCGTCAVSVNGQVCLACTHVIQTDEITVEPIPNHPVVRDLIVDRTRLSEIMRVAPYLVRKQPYEKCPEELPSEKMQETLEFNQCIHCLICTSVCPIVSGYEKWLGPELFTFANRYISDPRDGDGGRIDRTGEDLWFCSNCNSCNNACPWEIPILEGIDKLRARVIENGVVPRTLQDALKSIFNQGNPWGTGRDRRTQWADGLNLKRLPQDRAEILYFVGCTPSYDTRVRDVARSVVGVLEKGGVNFAILGNDEKCCGEPALRLGEENLFKLLAEENIQLFKKYEMNRVVTTCPHSYDVFKKEYPKYGGKFEVQHYTQVIADLVDRDKLTLGRIDKVATYHDPCFLAKHNNIYEEPRKILESIPGLTLVEMPRNKRNSFCCGGGGGRMWIGDPAEERPPVQRAKEAAKVDPDIIVTACPFCLMNLEDGVKTIGKQDQIKVIDLAELIGGATR